MRFLSQRVSDSIPKNELYYGSTAVDRDQPQIYAWSLKPPEI